MTVNDIGVPGQPLNTPPLTAWQAAVRDALGGNDHAAAATGERNITASLLNSFTAPGGGVFVRRVGRSVTLALLNVTRTAAVPGGVGVVVLGAPPAGFTPAAHVYSALNTTHPFDPAVPGIIAGGIVSCAYGANAWVNAISIPANGHLYVTWSYPTDDPWPTTLPGTPA